MFQAYTSQILALVMFALVISEDRISMQPRRYEIIDGLRKLPGKIDLRTVFSRTIFIVKCFVFRPNSSSFETRRTSFRTVQDELQTKKFIGDGTRL